MLKNFEGMDASQLEAMKEKTLLGFKKTIQKRVELGNYSNGLFVILPDRVNKKGFPVVSFIGVVDGHFIPSKKWDTWREIIMEANQNGMDFTERMLAKAALKVLKESELNIIYEAIDKSGFDANDSMVNSSKEGQVIICLIEEESVSFYIAESDEDGTPTKYIEKLEII